MKFYGEGRNFASRPTASNVHSFGRRVNKIRRPAAEVEGKCKYGMHEVRRSGAVAQWRSGAERRWSMDGSSAQPQALLCVNERREPSSSAQALLRVNKRREERVIDAWVSSPRAVPIPPRWPRACRGAWARLAQLSIMGAAHFRGARSSGITAYFIEFPYYYYYYQGKDWERRCARWGLEVCEAAAHLLGSQNCPRVQFLRT